MSDIKGLIIKEKWLNRMFAHQKLWEIRSSGTKVRGRIYLIQSGSKTIVGECCIVDCIKLNYDIFEQNRHIHTIEKNYNELTYKNPYAWIIDKDSIKKYENPIPYEHPSGAIIWVNLEGKCDLKILLDESKKVSYTTTTK